MRTTQWGCWLWGLAFPMFSEQATVPEKANPVGRWAARTVLVLFLLLILGLINNSEFIGLTNWIPHPIIGRIWLPLFDLLHVRAALARVVAVSRLEPGRRGRGVRVSGYRFRRLPGSRTR